MAFQIHVKEYDIESINDETSTEDVDVAQAIDPTVTDPDGLEGLDPTVADSAAEPWSAVESGARLTRTTVFERFPMISSKILENVAF